MPTDCRINFHAGLELCPYCISTINIRLSLVLIMTCAYLFSNMLNDSVLLRLLAQFPEDIGAIELLSSGKIVEIFPLLFSDVKA